MTMRAWLPAMAAIGLVFTAACGSHTPKAQTPKATPSIPPPAPPVTPPPPPVDPISALITTSQQHYDAGERELKVGHLDRARSEFDRSLDVLLESPYGARTEPRLRAHFDRLVDRISTYEVKALAEISSETVKKKTFVLAADIAMSSGEVDAAEEEMLEAMQRVLGIDDALANSIVQVLALKYKS